MTYLLHHLMSEAATRDAGRPAVRCAGRSLSYGELDASANALARTLIDAGVGRGDRVGIHLPKRPEMVVAVYAALKAGAAYVPLDPLAPAPRLATVAADCGIAALVTTPGRAAALLPALGADAPRIVILVDDGTQEPGLDAPTVSFDQAASGPAADPGIPAVDSDLAYILYTSGSTGMPKGVMLTHRNALTFVEWAAGRIGTGPGDRFSNHAPLHFDLSVFDLYVAASGGAEVILVPEEQASFGAELARIIREERITVWYSVPSALMLLTKVVEDPEALASLRAVVFAGEVYPTKHLRALRALVPGADLWNLYGPTETNVCTYHRVGALPEDDRTIPIGRACENTEVFALREDGGVAGVGEEGELLVRGSTVMAGYWNRRERTEQVLVDNPLVRHRREPIYRTGDLVRLRPDGDYDFLGRRDHQIKSRGYRIELGEVEAALNAHPAVSEAAAVAVPHEEWGTAIVAFVAPHEGQEVTEREVKRHVAERLPRYMVPARVEISDAALPRTSTGKIDRRRLLEPAPTPVPAS